MTWRFAPTAALIAIVLTSQGAHAAFLGRLETAPGSGIFQAYYDDQLNITWAADANINGTGTWDNQMAWVGNLTIGGVSGWRLPNMDVNNDGTIVTCLSNAQAACMDNELGHLNRYGAGTAGAGLGIRFGLSGPFSNLQLSPYWSSTVAPNSSAWQYALINGSQGPTSTIVSLSAWAVHDGDVIPGDLDANGFVDILDLNIVLANWNTDGLEHLA